MKLLVGISVKLQRRGGRKGEEEWDKGRGMGGGEGGRERRNGMREEGRGGMGWEEGREEGRGGMG